MPRIIREVRVALLHERVPSLLCFVGHVRQSGGFPGEHLLADEAVVFEVERVLQHSNRGGTLAVDFPGPVEGHVLQFLVGNRLVDHTHLLGFLGGVGLAEEEYLAGFLLADLPGEVGRSEPAVETRHVGVGLEEFRVFFGSQRHVTDHVEAVTAADGPPRHDADDGFRDVADETLDFEDVQAARLRCSLAVGILSLIFVPFTAANALVAAGAERPPAVLRGRAVAGQEDTADIGLALCVVERAVQFVHRSGAEGVPHVRSVERDSNRPLLFGSVVRDVAEIEVRNFLPSLGVEEF